MYSNIIYSIIAILLVLVPGSSHRFRRRQRSLSWPHRFRQRWGAAQLAPVLHPLLNISAIDIIILIGAGAWLVPSLPPPLSGPPRYSLPRLIFTQTAGRTGPGPGAYAHVGCSSKVPV